MLNAITCPTPAPAVDAPTVPLERAPVSKPLPDIPAALAELVGHLKTIGRKNASPTELQLCKALDWTEEQLRSVVRSGVDAGRLVVFEGDAGTGKRPKPTGPLVMLSEWEAEKEGWLLRASESPGVFRWKWVIEKPDGAWKKTKRTKRGIREGKSGERTSTYNRTILMSELRNVEEDHDESTDWLPTEGRSIADVGLWLDATALYKKKLIRPEFLEIAANYSGIEFVSLGRPLVSPDAIECPRKASDMTHPPERQDPGPNDPCNVCGGKVGPESGSSTRMCLTCDRMGVDVPAGEAYPGPRKKGKSLKNQGLPKRETWNKHERDIIETIEELIREFKRNS